jgi:site-specific recombinase XerD
MGMDQRAHEILHSLDFDAVVRQYSTRGGKSTHTIRGYGIDLRRYRDWAQQAGLHPLAVSHTDINRFARDLRDDPELAARTKLRVFRAVKSFFSYVSQTYQVVSPADHPDIVVPGDDPDLTPPEVMDLPVYARFIRVGLSADPMTALQVALLGINGLSIQELCRANVQDVVKDRAEWRLMLPSRGEGKATPFVGLEKRIVQEAIDGRASGALALNEARNRANRNSVIRLLSRVSASANAGRVTPRLLRSTAAVVAASEGATQEAIRDMLGIGSRRAERYMMYPGFRREEHAAVRVWRSLHPERRTNELMDQVQRLRNEEGGVPLAAIALAGAALEQHLRKMCEEHEIEVEGRSSIDRYKGLLIKHGRLSAREGARIDRLRDLRNDAVHGKEGLTEDDADEMLSGVQRLIESRS